MSENEHVNEAINEADNELTYRGDLGHHVEFTAQSFNKNEEVVFLKDYLLPEGRDVRSFIKEDTNSISRDLVDGSKDLGYEVGLRDTSLCLLLTRVSKNGIYPSTKGVPRENRYYNETEVMLIESKDNHKLLVSSNYYPEKVRRNYYVETGKFLDSSGNKYYNCKLHTKDKEGKVVTHLFAPIRSRDYDKLFSNRENLSENVSSLVSSTLRAARRVNPEI